MLAAEKNHELTQVGAGAPMGDYLRRYWHPIAGASELADNPVKPVRLMGEDLVLYKDLSGHYGLVDRHCPHRRADLSYGFVEQCGLRCNYHGWLFDADGSCLEQPYEDQAAPEMRFREKIKIKSYQVRELAGLLFAYMGPEPAPQLPDWEPFSRENGFVQIVTADIPCNWVQCQENSIDPVHFEWMHGNWSVRLRNKGEPYGPKHLKLDFDEFDFGLLYKRITTSTNEQDPLWTVGRVLLWPNAFFLGNHFEWRVPVDDTHTLSVGWFYKPVPLDRRPYRQSSIPTWHSPIKDEATGRWISSHVINQDIIGWVGQGAITDRTQEHLGQSDKGIVLFRRRLFAELEAMKSGAPLKALILDESKNKCVSLPVAGHSTLPDNGVETKFTMMAGQPEWVRKAQEEAMGQPIDNHGIL